MLMKENVKSNFIVKKDRQSWKYDMQINNILQVSCFYHAIMCANMYMHNKKIWHRCHIALGIMYIRHIKTASERGLCMAELHTLVSVFLSFAIRPCYVLM